MDDLCLELNAKTLDFLFKALNDPSCNDPKKQPIQNMKAMAKSYMRFAQDYKPYWLMLFNHHLPEERKALDWYQEKIDRLFEPLENLLEIYFSSQQFRKRKIAARVLWASVHGLCFLQETGKISVISDRGGAPDMVEYLINTFIAGIHKK